MCILDWAIWRHSCQGAGNLVNRHSLLFLVQRPGKTQYLVKQHAMNVFSPWLLCIQILPKTIIKLQSRIFYYLDDSTPTTYFSTAGNSNLCSYLENNRHCDIKSSTEMLNRKNKTHQSIILMLIGTSQISQRMHLLCRTANYLKTTYKYMTNGKKIKLR